MQVLDNDIETIHLYVVKDDGKKPFNALPLFRVLLCLAGIIWVTLYSAEHPYYEHERLRVPAIYLPLKVFKAEAPIIPTGVKTYAATDAHGYLTFSNGSVIGQSVPAGFIIDGAVTDYPAFIPPATPTNFGMATVSAHLLTSGINLSTLSINEVVGSSLFIRNLSPFTGGHPAYSVTYQQPIDRINRLKAARSSVAAQEAQIQAFLSSPCTEDHFRQTTKMVVTLRCQFVTYSVPSYMHVTAARLSGPHFLVDVSFLPLPKPIYRK